MQWKRIPNVLATDPPVVHAIRKEGDPCLEACFRSKGRCILTVYFQSLRRVAFAVHCESIFALATDPLKVVHGIRLSQVWRSG